jgi:hypothetical protein
MEKYSSQMLPQGINQLQILKARKEVTMLEVQQAGALSRDINPQVDPQLSMDHSLMSEVRFST